MIDTRKIARAALFALLLYAAIAAAFFFVSGDQLDYQDKQSDTVSPTAGVGEVLPGMEVRQRFTAQGDELRGVSIPLATYGRENTSTLRFAVENEAGETVGETELPTAGAVDSEPVTALFSQVVPLVKGGSYTLVITSPDGAEGNAVSVWYGATMALRSGSIPVQIADDERVEVNGTPLEGKLTVSFLEREYLWFGAWYWAFALGLGALIGAYGIYTLAQAKKGRASLVLRVCAAFSRYSYLIRQLVSRDFKAKYKRSVLGVLWSLLNPVLTMLVQYVVFSSLFKSDIPNFALYLIIGIVCYSFFNESVTMSLTSITGNAGLITKVYMPKYIYPFSRTISSGVNLLLSLIPLFGMMLLTRTPLRPAVLLLPFGLACLFMLSLGMGMLLATLMVFFRDTQFLWGVASMLWMYLTPIMYPENIIPAQYMTLYKCNPLYHIIRFMRIVLMDGVSPEPKAYALCLIASVAPLAVGALAFWKKQDSFVMNL